MDQIEAKIVLLGDTNVGKTSLVQRFVNDKFNIDQSSSSGAAFVMKHIDFEDKNYILKIWDTAGQEKYRSIAKNYYKDAKVALLIYDITKKQTFENIMGWLDEILDKGPKDVQLIIVGNKQDLDQYQEVQFDDAMQLANNFGAVVKLTSCKDNIGVDDLFLTVCKCIQYPKIKKSQSIQLPSHQSTQQDQHSHLIHIVQNQNTDKKSKCCD